MVVSMFSCTFGDLYILFGKISIQVLIFFNQIFFSFVTELHVFFLHFGCYLLII